MSLEPNHCLNYNTFQVDKVLHATYFYSLLVHLHFIHPTHSYHKLCWHSKQMGPKGWRSPCQKAQWNSEEESQWRSVQNIPPNGKKPKEIFRKQSTTQQSFRKQEAFPNSRKISVCLLYILIHTWTDLGPLKVKTGVYRILPGHWQGMGEPGNDHL